MWIKCTVGIDGGPALGEKAVVAALIYPEVSDFGSVERAHLTMSRAVKYTYQITNQFNKVLFHVRPQASVAALFMISPE